MYFLIFSVNFKFEAFNIILQYDVDLIQNVYLKDLQFKILNGK